MITALLATVLVPHAREFVSIEPIPSLFGEKARVVDVGRISNTGYVAMGTNKTTIGGAFIPQLWSQTGGIAEITLPAGTTTAIVKTVNSRGEAVGAYNSGSVDRPFIWSKKTGFKPLPDLGGGGYATSINEKGWIAGRSSRTGNYPQRAVLYRTGAPTELEPAQGFLHSVAEDVNDSGQVVGMSYGGSTEKPSQATLWEADGGAIALPLLPGATAAHAWSLNNKGTVVGACDGVGPFIYADGVVKPIATLGRSGDACDVNNRDEAVGIAYNAKHEPYGFLYEDGAVRDLNTFLPEKSGWYILEARSINDQGEIVGKAFFQGKERGFLMKLR